MRHDLMRSTALLGVVGMIETAGGAANASDGIKLDVGGFFRTAFQGVIDDNAAGSGGHDRSSDGVFSDAKVYFTGEIQLDSGLTAGADVELVGETADEQIDEAYVYFSGAWGEVRIGSEDGTIEEMCVTPPGGSTNFGATSPNQWAANTVSPLSSNSVCSDVDDNGGAQKIVYFTPVFSGFQLGVSYTPNGGRKGQTDGVGPHVGMPAEGFDSDGDDTIDTTESRHNVSAYVIYNYDGDDWSLNWGAGGAWQGQTEKVEGNADARRDFYQTGLNLTFGDFAIGAAFEYYNNYAFISGVDGFIVAGGMAYTLDAWTFGVQYAYSRLDITVEAPEDSDHFNDSGDDFTMNRLAATAEYTLEPGISVDGEVAYTWTDADGNADLQAGNHYDAVEFGIGTAFEF